MLAYVGHYMAPPLGGAPGSPPRKLGDCLWKRGSSSRKQMATLEVEVQEREWMKNHLRVMNTWPGLVAGETWR